MTAKKKTAKKPKRLRATAILSRKGYVERIHECYWGQGISMATHDVLMQHDAALRKAARRA